MTNCKCKDCKYARRRDSWNIKCFCDKYEYVHTRGNGTHACEYFEKTTRKTNYK